MLSWEQMDKLNAIATDQDKSAEARASDIAAFMRTWGMLANEGANAWDYTPDWSSVAIPRETDIDPYAQSKGGIALPGQPGHTYHPGY